MNHSPLRVLFLHPKTIIDSWPAPVDTLGEVIKIPSTVYPVLAGSLKGLAVGARAFDGYVDRVSWSAYRQMLQEADVIAITVMSPLKALDTHVSLRLIKRLNPAATIVLGGNHASAYPERWLDAGADYIVVKDGDIAFPEIIKAILTGDVAAISEIPAVVCRANLGRPQGALPRLALDATPMPDWSVLNLQAYSLGLSRVGLTATVEMSRGCVHHCDFCNINKFWGFRQEYKSVDRVLDELRLLQGLGVTQFAFADDNFAHSSRHTEQLCERMLSEALDFKYAALIRADTVMRDEQYLDLLVRSGLRLALVGLETLDQEWLSMHRKGIRCSHATSEYYREVYGRLSKRGVFVLGLFINDHRSESMKCAGNGTVGVVCDYHYSGDLYIQKNSQLYDDAGDNGRAKDMFYHDWNLPSVSAQMGSRQLTRMGWRGITAGLSWTYLRRLFSRDPFTRLFYWRHVGVFLERLFCTRWDDWVRYRTAMNGSLSPQERQDRMIQYVLSDKFIDWLAKTALVRTPLGLRTGM